MQGFPSYLGLPVNYPILNHATGLTRYRASRYLARLPTRYAESGSLSLCAVHFLSLPSDPAVTSNALAIRIDFPLVGATSVSFNRPGLPATLGKPKANPAFSNAGFVSDLNRLNSRPFLFGAATMRFRKRRKLFIYGLKG